MTCMPSVTLVRRIKAPPEGESWRCLARHLPPILSVETLYVPGHVPG